MPDLQSRLDTPDICRLQINSTRTDGPVMNKPVTPIKGRGSASSLPGRFKRQHTEWQDDGWLRDLDDSPAPVTRVRDERARSIISSNRSPDIPFDRSINPYRGCEHGCIYCFARPSHAYLDLSPGIDFETQLSAKVNAPELFEQALRKPGYRCQAITLGINTDAYQPIERERRITRRLLEIALDYRQPVSIITKSGLILRDLDLLQAMAQQCLVHVGVSITTLNNDLKRIMEPRTASPAMRLRVMRELDAVGVPVTALVAPVIPAINDHEIEALLEAVAAAGARDAGYVLLRLPHEVAPLFLEWLQQHFPQRAHHVESLIRQSRGGKLYDSRWGERMRGRGTFAELIRQRFQVARRRHGLGSRPREALDCSRFRPPPCTGDQLTLPL